MAEMSALFQQLGKCSRLHYPPFVHDKYLIHLLQTKQSVGNVKNRAALHQGLQIAQKFHFSKRIKALSGFIQYQPRGIFEDGTGNGHPPSLPTGQFHTAFTDNGIQPIGLTPHKVIQLRRRQRRPEFVFFRIALGHQQIIANGGVKQIGALRNHRKILAQVIGREVFQFMPAELGRTTLIIIKTQQQIGDTAFSGPRSPQYRHLAARNNMKIQACQGILLPAGIAQMHILQQQIRLLQLGRRATGIGKGQGAVCHRENPSGCLPGLAQKLKSQGQGDNGFKGTHYPQGKHG